jgi:hypothetical protein
MVVRASVVETGGMGRLSRIAALLVLATVAVGPTGVAAAAPRDRDRDRLPDAWERNRSLTSPLRADTDRDGTSDAREDPDGDGLTNLTEYRAATDPRVADSDGDGLADGAEPMGGTTLRAAQSSGLRIIRVNTRAGRGAPTLPGAPGCPLFPATNVWNRSVAALPVAADSATLVASIGLDRGFHMDFGSYAGYGIPINVVSASTPRSAVSFDYDDESDHVGYPIPATPLIEGGSDRHILMVDRDACRLFELFDARKVGSAWQAGSGATWDLTSNALRPAGWTSADAAGLPIVPGLVRYDEVAAGAIRHALRFTAPQTRRAYVYPARHYASSSSSASLPPMGMRVRLKQTADLAGLSAHARTIAVALQAYGMILADNGSAWYVSGQSDPRFDDDGRDVEVVDTTGFVNGP